MTAPAQPGLVMSGAAGRMGRAILALAGEEGLHLTGALEHQGHSSVGTPAASLTGVKDAFPGVFVSDSPEEAVKTADVVIDFSGPDNTVRLAEECRKHKTALVVGTTGFTEEQLKSVQSASSDAAVLISPNMSLGVNLLFYLTKLTTGILHETADIEITEIHHRHKKDSPSGTAVRLKDIAVSKSGIQENQVIYGREGMTGARPKSEIAVHAIRGGDVVGEHTVSYFMDGERIELTHKASSRDTFARGALKAAKVLANKPAGLYSMDEIFNFGS